ncbi:Dicarboxylate transporter 2.1, chloroplastic [Linum perenne]
MERLATLHSFSATTTSLSLPYSRSSSLLHHRSPPKQPRFSPSASLSSSSSAFRPLRSPISASPLNPHFSILLHDHNSSSSSITSPSPVQGAKLVPLVISVGIGLIVRFAIAKPAAVTPQAWQLLAIFLSTIAGLVLSPLPVGAWAFLGLTTSIVTKTLSFSAAFSAFTSEVIWLIVISFFFARGFVKTGLGDRIATYFVKWLGKSTLGLSYGLTISEALIAPAMPSTTARAGGVFLPIIKSLSLSAGSKPGDPSSKKLGSYLLMSQFQVSILFPPFALIPIINCVQCAS